MVFDQFDEAFALGQRNAHVVKVAHNHCQLMKFVVRGGVGIVEQISGLPIGLRSVECPKAHGQTAAGNLWHVARDFYATNCVGCEMRRPTGVLPTLATLVLEEENAAEELENAGAQMDAALQTKREARAARRRALRAVSTPAMIKALDDLDLVDSSPTSSPEGTRHEATESREAALRRIALLAEKAPQTFTSDVVDAIVDVSTGTASTELLDPLRILGRSDPDLAARLTRIAVDALRVAPSQEAARAVVQFPEHVSKAALDINVVYHLLVTAYGPQDGSIGHLEANEATDPSVLDYLTRTVPLQLIQVLSDMLPGIDIPSRLLLPPGTKSEAGRTYGEFDRATAADAIAYLVTAGFPLVRDLVPAIVRNLIVPADLHDTYPHAAVCRTAALYVLNQVEGAEAAIEAAGSSASDEQRSELLKVWWHLSRLIDRGGHGWGAGSPRLTADERESLRNRVFAALMTFIDGRWGYEVASEAATTISSLTSDDATWAVRKLDALLGGFATAFAAAYRNPSTVMDTSKTTPSVWAPLEAQSRSMAYMAAAGHLLDAVETTARVDAPAALEGLLYLISHERTTSDETVIVWRLLPVLGSIARDHGAHPGVLSRVVPALYTHLVSADAGLIARAVRAWADARSAHALPSLFEDLLPTLLNDRRIVVINAILAAAPRLRLTERARFECFTYALRMTAAAEIDVRLDVLKAAILCASSLSRGQQGLPSRFENELLRRAAALATRDVEDVLHASWSPEAQRTFEYARLRLRLLEDALRDGDLRPRRDEEAVALIATGPGLTGLETEALLEAAVALGPRRVAAALTYVEVVWRAGRVADALRIAVALHESIPAAPAFDRQRRLTQTVTAAVAAELTSSEHIEAPSPADSDEMFRQLDSQSAIRARIRSLLRSLASAPLVEVDDLRSVASRLANDAAQLAATADRRTSTAAYVRHMASLLKAGAILLRAEAADLAGDSSAALQRATGRGLVAVESGIRADLGSDDPLAPEILTAITRMHAVRSDGDDTVRELSRWAELSIPLIVVEGPPLRLERRIDPEPSSPVVQTKVAVALVSIDDGLLTGPAVLHPHMVYKLGVEIQPEHRPVWASRVEVEFVGALSPQEIQLPVLTLPLHQDSDDVLTGSGTLVLRFNLPSGQPAPPFVLVARWAGVDEDGTAKYESIDIAGHAQIRLRPFDESRDQLTSIDIVDERLLTLYSSLPDTGYPDDELQAFARLFTAVCRSGFRRTWDRRYKRGTRVTERVFHDDMYQDLLEDPTLEGRVERGSPLALGFLDIRHDKITAELKVERAVPVTRQSAPKYMGQATQYAAADGRHLSILAILDMSPKELPVGTPENYLFTLIPAQHGLNGAEAPSIVAVIVVNGNLPVPSTWSRRKKGSTLASDLDSDGAK